MATPRVWRGALPPGRGSHRGATGDPAADTSPRNGRRSRLAGVEEGKFRADLRDATPTAAELRQVFEACDGNVSRVAAFFGKDRRQIYRWARRLGIAPETYRASEEGDDEGHDPAEGVGEV